MRGAVTGSHKRLTSSERFATLLHIVGSRYCDSYLVVSVDGVGVEVRRGGGRDGGRHDGVRHVRRLPAPVARLPPLARVVQHLRRTVTAFNSPLVSMIMETFIVIIITAYRSDSRDSFCMLEQIAHTSRYSPRTTLSSLSLLAVRG